MLHKMVETFGTKLFKSITATADEIGNKFELVFTNFSDAITDDANDVVIEVISLSNLIRIVLCILTVLLLLIILKYIALGINHLQSQWRKHSTTSASQIELFVLAVPVRVDFEDHRMVYDNVQRMLRLHADDSGRLMLNPLKTISTIHASDDQSPPTNNYF